MCGDGALAAVHDKNLISLFAKCKMMAKYHPFGCERVLFQTQCLARQTSRKASFLVFHASYKDIKNNYIDCI